MSYPVIFARDKNTGAIVGPTFWYNASTGEQSQYRIVFSPRITKELHEAISAYSWHSDTYYLAPSGSRFVPHGNWSLDGLIWETDALGSATGPEWEYVSDPTQFDFGIATDINRGNKPYSSTSLGMVGNALMKGALALAAVGGVIMENMPPLAGRDAALFVNGKVQTLLRGLDLNGLFKKSVSTNPSNYLLALKDQDLPVGQPMPQNEIFGQNYGKSILAEMKEINSILKRLLTSTIPGEPVDNYAEFFTFLRDALDFVGKAFGATSDLGTILIPAIPGTLAAVDDLLENPIFQLLQDLFESEILEAESVIEEPPPLPPDTSEVPEDPCCIDYRPLLKDVFYVDDKSPFYTTPDGVGLADVMSIPTEPFPPFLDDPVP